MDPLPIDLPERLETARLVLRPPQSGDGARLNAAVCASLPELTPWMPWAQAAPTPDESETYCRRQHAVWRLREGFALLMLARDESGGEGDVVGATGLHDVDWAVRRFEIGYWCRSGFTGRGYATEAVRAVTRFAFDRLQARRVEIRMDAGNERSRRVAERAGFTFEGVLRRDSLTPRGEPCDTRVHARVRGIEEPAAIDAA